MVQKFNLKKEHEKIERELVELETIMDVQEGDEVNYTNLTHVFKKLNDLWNAHENSEQNFFKKLFKKSEFPLKKMTTAHKLLHGHFKAITEAINSGSENKILASLDTDGRMFIKKLRDHMKEDESLFDKAISKS
ncbi:MAG: hemerythrin domain-containing protein [Nanoarchaeota archaeon]|nr:hemerythrin domain-containing protein [Nanoarchaeota archaeon]